MDKAQYTACPDLRHSPRNSPLRSAFSTLSASNGSPARGSPQRRTNRSDSPHGICLLDTQPGTPQPLAAHTETTKSFKLGSVAGAVLQSPNKKLYVAHHKRALRRPRELQFEPVPDACNGGRSQATKASAREQHDPHHKIITAVMAAEANKSKMRAEAQTEEKDERARSEEGEDENEEETHRTTTAKPMATTATTTTTTEYENVDNYFSELIDNGKAEEDHMGWGKPILEKKMPARKNQANQSEKVREAQEKTKRLMAGNDLQDALTGAITTRLVRSRYDVQEKQKGEQKRLFSPVDPPKISRPRTRQKAEPKPKPKPVVITIDDDDSMSQDSFTEVSSAAPPKKRARSDTPSYYSPRVVFGRMDYADVQWEIRWEQAELVIRTVKQLTAADDGEDPFAFDDGDGDYAPDEPKQRNAKRKEKPLERAEPKATEDREFLIPYTDLARVAELTSTGLVAVRTRTILSQIDSNYYDPQNRDGSRHYIHIYCSNWNDWREEWHKVKTILAEASIKVASITEAAYAEFNIGALDQQTVTSSIDSIRRYTTRSMSRKPTTTRRFISTKKIITYPPGRSRDVVTLTQADVERLEPEQLLNDNIIEFYLKYLHEEALFPENAPQRDQFYFFNTFFWPKLQSLKSEDQMKNLLSWTRNVDIFKKRFLFVPINDGFHWNVVVICNPGSIVHAQTPGAMDKLPKEEWPVMVHMCSLHSTAGHVFNKLRAYLGVAWNADDSRPTIKVTKDSLLGFIPNLPEQQNGSDCGVFLLQYVEGFCRNPPTLYTKEDLKVTLNRSWFDNETIVQKRREIKDLIARIACEQEPVTDEPEQAEGPKDEAEAAAANTATTATTPSSAGDAPVKSGSGDEGEAPPSCGGEVEVDVVDEEANRNETRMDPKNEDEDDDDTQMPIERGGVEGHTGAMEVEEAEEGAKAARDDFSLGSDFTPPSPLSLNSAPVSSDDELLKELVEQETDDIMPTSGAARLPSPGLSPPRLTTTREVALADLDEGEGEGSGETPGMALNVARWSEKRKRKGEERRRGTNKIKKATAGRGGDGERDQPCAVLSVPSSPQSRAEDNENEDEEEEEQGTQKAAGDEGDSYIDIWDLLPRFLLGSDPEVTASKQRNRERDDNDEEEEGEGKTTKRRAKRQKREEDGSSGVEDEAEEAVITAVVPASSSSTGVRGSTVDTAAARPPGRALAASPHRQKVPVGEGGQTVVVDIGEEKEEGEQRKAKEEKEKEKRAAQSRSRGATGTKGEGWWSKVSGSLGLRSVWPTTTPTAAVGPAGESMHGRQLIPAPLPPPPGQDEDPLLNGRHEEERTMTTPTPTPTSTSTTPTAAAVETTTTTSSGENDINSSGSGKRKRRRKRRSKRKQGDGSQADDSAGGSLSSEASLSIDGEGGSPEFHVVYDAVAVADREAVHHAGGRWDTTEVKEEANDGENEQASEEMRNAVEEGGGKEEGEEASNDNDSGTISDPHPGRLRQANGPRSVAGRTKTKEKGLAMNEVTKKGNGTPTPATRTLGP